MILFCISVDRELFVSGSFHSIPSVAEMTFGDRFFSIKWNQIFRTLQFIPFCVDTWIRGTHRYFKLLRIIFVAWDCSYVTVAETTSEKSQNLIQQM